MKKALKKKLLNYLGEREFGDSHGCHECQGDEVNGHASWCSMGKMMKALQEEKEEE